MSDKPHVLIVESRYYTDISEELFLGAEAELDSAGASFERVEVPGAFEIPAAVRIAIRSMDFFAGRRRYDGYITLGCVIRGETSHYDYVCGESARKLQDLACDRQLAIGYGILTRETRDQAWARAAVAQKNKGGDAAQACLDMIALRRALAG